MKIFIFVSMLTMSFIGGLFLCFAVDDLTGSSIAKISSMVLVIFVLDGYVRLKPWK